MKAFEDYGQAVCAHVRHATAKEKAAIRKELTDHMEDHAQALLDAGYDADHAHRVALTAMGDPGEVGRALDRAYPFRWLALATILRILLVILLLYLVLFSAGWNATALWRTWEARTDPMRGHSYIPVHAGDIYPLDLRQELPGGTVLYVYGVARDDRDQVWVYTVSYPRNPFQNSMNPSSNLTFTYGDTDTGTFAWQNVNVGSNGSRDAYYRYCLDEVQKGDILTAHYDHFGFSFAWEIPWEEASP